MGNKVFKPLRPTMSAQAINEATREMRRKLLKKRWEEMCRNPFHGRSHSFSGAATLVDR